MCIFVIYHVLIRTVWTVVAPLPCLCRAIVCSLNKTGFSKVLKKYDKTLDRKLKSQYMREKVEKSPTFQADKREKVNDKIAIVEQTYADIYSDGDVDKAKRELRLDLREHVVWERNTVWREMIGIERKAQAAHLGARQTILGHKADNKHSDEGSETKELATPAGRFRCPSFLFQSSVYILIAALAVFAVLLLVPILELPEQQNCLAMVVFVSMLWATEVSSLLGCHDAELTRRRRYLYSSRRCLCPSLWWCCALLGQTRHLTSGLSRSLRRGTSLGQCGLP